MKYVFAGINLLLITLLAYISVQGAYMKIGMDPLVKNNDSTGENTAVNLTNDRQQNSRYQIQNQRIVQRNLFNVLTEGEKAGKPLRSKPAQAPKPLEKNTSSISLKGTVTGGNFLFAVIEDKKTRKQGLYKSDDTLGEIRLKEILTDHIIIEENAKLYRIEMDESSSKRFSPNTRQPFSRSRILSDTAAPSSIPEAVLRQKQIRLENDFISNTLNNIDTIKNQVKFRPHHSAGKPDGILIYGIRPNSVFTRLGLRNGDVIKQVNDTDVTGSEDALASIMEFASDSTATISFIRAGQPNQIVYTITEPEEGVEDEE